MVFIALILSYRYAVLGLSLLGLTVSLRKPSCQVSNQSLKNEYCFVFPVYKEQKVIADTFHYYESFLQKSEKVSLLFVTTTKEQGKGTTKDLLNELINQSQYKARITAIESVVLTGTKATQLNVALTHLRSKETSMPYLVCFDCDARISWEDFKQAEEQLDESYYLYSFLPKPGLANTRRGVKALMLHHGERMLVWEYVPAHVKFSFWHYPMGATLVVHPGLWQKVECFPEPIDDIPLQYVLHWQKLKFRSLPYYSHVQAPPNLSNAFRQMIPIFTGVFSYFSLAKRISRTLNLKEKLTGLGWYGLLISEFLAIAISPYILITRPVAFVFMYLLPALIQLIWLRTLRPINVILYFCGMYLRLAQFIYFVVRGLLFPANLAAFKTEREDT